MAIEIFPTKNDVGGSAKGRRISEENLSGQVGRYRVVSGFNELVNQRIEPGGGTNPSVVMAAGEALIRGFRVVSTDTLTIQVNGANTWAHVKLKLTRDGAQKVSGATLIQYATLSADTNDEIMLWSVRTDSALEIAQSYDRRCLSEWGCVLESSAHEADAANGVVLGFRPRKLEVFGSGVTAIDRYDIAGHDGTGTGLDITNYGYHVTDAGGYKAAHKFCAFR
jgi:hypothetical protein